MRSGFASYPQVNFEDLIQQIETSLPSLPRQEAKLAQFMLLNLNTLGLETGKSLAEKVGVPEVTVGRLLRRLGCNGMKELKELLRQRYSVAGEMPDPRGDVRPAWEKTMEAETAIVAAIFHQTTSPDWVRAAKMLTETDRIFVTGFQSVRGLAEDFARRLSLARPSVQYLSPHDGMLGEWLVPNDPASETSCLVLVDVVPYAAESESLAKLAKKQGRSCIVLSDEYCHWSRDVADSALYAPSNTGLFLESTVGLNLALSLLVDSVAESDLENSQARLVQWKKTSRGMRLF
ncbi:MAG: MurR/RpiR family transcriptional regulator [Alphaproteobacteria bacterium]|nr:MurR/RpiR family transcriptional regulator [Alphaproteobacteria bacterium]